MAELSRTFQAGRMNQDFDERLVPPGEYRDALNLDLSSSEGSDIGALQMLKGNVEFKNKSYNASTKTHTVWPDNEYISSYTNAFCVGSIADNTNNKIYWLVGSEDYSCIAEYDLETQVISPVLVEDKAISNFLNFSLDYLVTGINLLEGYLIWTDNQTEPKQIEIKLFKDSTVDFVTHTNVYGRNMIEKDTTVAKLGPLHAPDLALLETTRSISVDSTINYNFAATPTGNGESAPSISADTEITVTLNSPAEYYSGDILRAYGTVQGNSGSQLISYLNLVVTSGYEDSSGGYNYTLIFKSVGSGGEVQGNFVIDDTLLYDIELQGEKILFEKKFVTWAYRFVYENNQVSPFSAFSSPAFVPRTYDFESYTGYNKGMLNNLKRLQVYFAKDITEDVASVDVLFKETHNTTVYTVKNIKRGDLGQLYNKYTITVSEDETQNCTGIVTGISLGAQEVQTPVNIAPGASLEIYGSSIILGTSTTPGGIILETVVAGYGLEINSEITRGAVEPNQLLRPWDNTPKKALAQEVIGNRVVYANYTQNYTIEQSIDFDLTKTILNQQPFNSDYQVNNPYRTIKSMREYQIGIVFKDEYGRETPVFSNENALVDSDITNSDFNCFITAGMSGISPKNPDGSEMFEYFKFFVKEPSLEYYNVVADQLYLSPDNLSAWVSFPSSEVNKFQVGDHIILKKGHGNSDAIKTLDNKYKVLAIESEPPEDIAFAYDILANDNEDFSAAFPIHTTATELTYGNTPVKGSNTFSLANPDSNNGYNSDNLSLNKYIRFHKDGVFSKYYRITQSTKVHGSFLITVSPSFGSDVDFMYDSPNDEQALLLSPIIVEVSERSKIETFEEFKGRFFARVERNQTLTNSFLNSRNLVDGQAATFNNQPANWYNGKLDTAGVITHGSGSSDAILGPNEVNSSFNDGWYFVGGGMGPESAGADGYQDPNRAWVFGGLNDNAGPVYGNDRIAIWGTGVGSSLIQRFQSLEGVNNWRETGGSGPYFSGIPVDLEGDITLKTGLSKYSATNKPWDLRIGRRKDAQLNQTGNFLTTFNKVKVGTKIRFSNHPTIYTVVERKREDGWETYFISMLFDKRLEHPVNAYAMYNIINYNNRPAGTHEPLPYTETFFDVLGQQYLPIDRTDPQNPTGRIDIEMILQEAVLEEKKITEDPAVFETEPEESLDLNLYYEATEPIPISKYNQTHRLPWFNAYGFGNGIESNRIRDDFNAFQLGKGAKVSTVLDDPYEEENRENGFIFSQIFNSTSGVNRLNQFIQALPITKDLNPIYGGIQKLYARDTDLITLCEDKCFRVLANKDALFNADGNTNITGNTAVLGQAVPYVGEFGIGTNPESFAFYGFRAYFADKGRGAVLRLSRDGLTEISSKGMGDFFSDNLKENTRIIGSYDQDSNLYNITLDTLTSEWQEKLAEGDVDRNDCDVDVDIAGPKATETTVSFAEATNGWESRKSFIPESGVSINNGYYTFKNGLIWKHGDNETHNNFYGEQSFSTVTAVFNDAPSIVKGFKTIDYVGSRPRNYVYTNGDGINYSIAQINAGNIVPTGQSVPSSKEGWYAKAIVTDMQEGQIKEFITKENKHFNYIKGIETFFNSDCDTNVSTSEFSVQGIGRATSITGDIQIQQYKVRIFADINCYVP